ncbi:MAG: Glutamine transport ATP-binding protein GlnQ [Planctomycetota bacterium]|jgi:ABC-type polar amino acid transport system ATPase subunit
MEFGKCLGETGGFSLDTGRPVKENAAELRVNSEKIRRVLAMIEISNVRKSYGAREVLRGVSLRVRGGEVAALIGRSGCGKSSLLRIINGLESYDSGDVRVGGVQLPAGTGRERERALLKIRQHVGMVFQKCHLFPHLTVLQNIIEAPIHVLGHNPAEAAAEAFELLQRVGLRDKANTSPEALSGGEQQRVAIARTLAMRPSLILLDEPTSALDPRSSSEIASLLLDLARQGQGMIVVSHTPSFVRAIAGTVYALQEGRIVESGPADQVLNNPQHAATIEFLRSVEPCGV